MREGRPTWQLLRQVDVSKVFAITTSQKTVPRNDDSRNRSL
ncbi:MAG TPA: hypothetical protein VEC36_02425 [Patescibacteria group bacterium]|nr:hypothetical protein [Patescibacteria group bacterium]